MKKIMIKVGGKEVPCRLTMGELLLFKRNMGKDISEMSESEKLDAEVLLMLMWCCIVCACKADGVEFDMDFELFTCNVTQDDVESWNEALGAVNEKKSD